MSPPLLDRSSLDSLAAQRLGARTSQQVVERILAGTRTRQVRVRGALAAASGGELTLAAVADRSQHQRVSPGSVQPLEPVHRGMLLVDMEGFNHPDRDDRTRVMMREVLFGLLASGLVSAGINSRCFETFDLGDGFLGLAMPEVSKVRLLDPLITGLAVGLSRYNRAAGTSARMRLRVVVHAGEVIRDERGYVGEELNFAFRLLDADALRACLAQWPAELALLVSGPIYHGVVKHGWGAIDVSAYRPVEVTAKETVARAWIRVPGADAPAGPGGSA